MKRLKLRWILPTALIALGLLSFPVFQASGHEAPSKPRSTMPAGTDSHMMPMENMGGMRMPKMDPARGRKLFVTKGCVACHSINGVGGHDATPLDAHTMVPAMNPFDFAAKMWSMAPAMIYAQEEALGSQILFTGDELADLIAFVHDDREQHALSDASITPEIRKLMHHTHGEPGGGVATHGSELGHKDGDTHGGPGHNMAPAPTSTD